MLESQEIMPLTCRFEMKRKTLIRIPASSFLWGQLLIKKQM
jgi:hypothetical protein